jgi:hypothetical protein
VLSPAGLLGGMTYAKAAVITLVLLPFVNVFALGVGAVLAVKTYQRQRAS